MTNNQKTAIALGERTGMDVAPEDVAIFGGWLFHNDPSIDDVDVYKLPLPMCAEPWTGCKVEHSPFGTKNQATLQATIAKIEA